MKRNIEISSELTQEQQEELLKSDPRLVNDLLEAGHHFALVNLVNTAETGNDHSYDFLKKLFYARPENLKAQLPVVKMTLLLVSGIRYDDAGIGEYIEIFDYINNPTLENAESCIRAHSEVYEAIVSYHPDKFELFKFVISEGIQHVSVTVRNGAELDFVMSNEDYLKYVDNLGQFRLNGALKQRLKTRYPDFFAKIYPVELVSDQTRVSALEEIE